MNKSMFTDIKKEYDDFHKSLLRKGKLPLGSTGKGFWGENNRREIERCHSYL